MPYSFNAISCGRSPGGAKTGSSRGGQPWHWPNTSDSRWPWPRCSSNPELPINFDVLVPLGTPDDERRRLTANPAAYRRETEEFYSKFLPNYLKDLKRVDIAVLAARVGSSLRPRGEFADVPGVPPLRQDHRRAAR